MSQTVSAMVTPVQSAAQDSASQSAKKICSSMPSKPTIKLS